MAPPEEIPNVHYEQLAELEKKFEDVDLEISTWFPGGVFHYFCPRGN